MFHYGGFTLLSGGVVASAILGVSSDSFFGVWVLLEVNMLMFLGLMMAVGAKPSSLTKYFIVQSAGSVVFFGASLIASRGGYAELMGLGGVALGMKLGAAPFHQWAVSLLLLENYLIFFFFCTVQKLIPVYGILTVSPGGLLVLYTVSAALGSAVGAMASTSLKELLAYYSILSVGWMLVSQSLMSSAVYLIIFSVGVWAVLSAGLYETNNMCNIVSSLSGVSWAFGMLSILGVPPLLGFMAKVLIVATSLSLASLVPLAALIGGAIVFIYKSLSALSAPLALSASVTSWSKTASSSSGSLWSALVVGLSGASMAYSRKCKAQLVLI